MAEKDISDLVSQFRLFFEKASVGAAMCDSAGNCFAVNSAMPKIIGSTRDEILAQNFRELDSWARSGLLQSAERALETQEIVIQRVALTSSFGKKIVIQVEFNSISCGEELFLLVQMQDLTVQSKLEEKRQAAEEELKLYMKMVSATKEAMSFIDPNYIFLAVNEAYLHRFNLQREDVIGKHVKDSLGEKVFDERWKPIFDTCLASEEVHFQGWLQFPKVGLRCAEIRSFPSFDHGQNVSGVVSVISDVTKRAKAEESLKRNEEQYHITLENLSIGVVVHGADTSVILSNPEAHRILSLSAEQISGKRDVDPHWHFVHEDMRRIKIEEYPVNLVKATLQPLKNYVLGVIVPEREGIIWVSVNAVPVFDGQGNLEKIIVNFYDITSLKSMEEQLRQSEKMRAIGQLAGGIAHDFNNQLAGIVGYADLIQGKFSNDEPMRKFADGILLSAQRATNLTNQLLAFARKGKYQIVPLDLHRIIGEVVQMLRRTIDKKIVIKQRLDAPFSVTLGDPSQVQNAIMNLALNARDAMPQGGEITISTETKTIDSDFEGIDYFQMTPGEFVELSVHDNGTGIEDAIKDKIFEPFFTTKKQGKGTGMGLASVFGTMNAHRGAIALASKVGKGTTVSLFFQLSDQKASLETVDAPSKNKTDGKFRVLVVDDEPAILDVCVHILEHLGHSVVTCGDGLEAIDYYLEHWKNIDLVVLDMVMPKMGGATAYKRMKSINPNVTVLLSTGYSLDGEAQGMLDAGVNGFIQKPFRKGDLADKISTLQGIKTLN